MFNDQLAGQQITISSERLEEVEEYVYPRQMVSANPAYNEEIKRI